MKNSLSSRQMQRRASGDWVSQSRSSGLSEDSSESENMMARLRINEEEHEKEESDSTEEEHRQATNLIVNYLPPRMNQDDVKALFISIGKVDSCKLIRDKSTGESLGYAFINYFKSKDAKKAIKVLNGFQLQNKIIKVSFARPSSDAIKGANLYVSALPRRMTCTELEDLFSPFGKIITARILYDNRTGISRGVAFIRFDQKQQAEQAVRHLNGFRPSTDEGLADPIIVKFANSPTVLKQQSFLKNNLWNFFVTPVIFAGWHLEIRNLTPETQESDLWQLFGPFGAVQSVKLNNTTGSGSVVMKNYEEAFRAVCTLNGVTLGDQLLEVFFQNNHNLHAAVEPVPVSTQKCKRPNVKNSNNESKSLLKINSE